MNLEKYSVVSDNNHVAYEFLSEGPNGTIKKVVFYQEVEENVFNIGFGDWDEQEQKINDSARSNNRDMNKVLATVASTVTDFIKHHPKAIIFAEGFTPSRTRLYQLGIQANWKEIGKLFYIAGFREGEWEFFEKGRNYKAFSLKAK